jgi:hypothetical protein
MFIPVLYISSLIHIFSTDYMSEDPRLVGIKLSNSGELLKTIIQKYILKCVIGLSNDSIMVISYSMIESEMDNRGSKSVMCFKLNCCKRATSRR